MYFISVIFYIHFNKKPSSLTNDNPSFLTHRELLNNNNNNNNISIFHPRKHFRESPRHILAVYVLYSFAKRACLLAGKKRREERGKKKDENQKRRKGGRFE